MAVQLHESVLHAKMERCEVLHSIVCIAAPCSNCYQPDKQSRQEYKNLRPPKLELRRVDNRYYVDVYSPEKLWQPMQALSSVIRNPVCIMQDGSTRVNNVCLLDLQKKLSWSGVNTTDLFEYSISKQVYRVIAETEGYLSCHALTDQLEEIVTEKIIYWTDVRHYIFAVGLLYKVASCSLELCEATYSENYWETLAQNLNIRCTQYGYFRRIIIQPVKMENRFGNKLSLVFRVKILYNSSNTDTLSDLYNLQQLKLLLETVAVNNTDGLEEVVYVRSSKFCHQEQTNDSTVLHWGTATIGQTVLPTELCIGEDGAPVQRKCAGDFVTGAVWSNEGKYKCFQPSSRMSYLYSLSTFRTRTPDNATKILKELNNVLSSEDVRDPGNFARTELQYVARTMKNLKDGKLQSSDLALIANITDSLMGLTAARTGARQAMSNASNIVLESLDSMLNIMEANKTQGLTITPRFVSLVMDVEENSSSYNGIRGIALLKSETAHFTGKEIMTLPWNMSLDSLLTMDISTAVFLPPQLINPPNPNTCKIHSDIDNNSFKLQCLNDTTGSENRKPHRLVINLFWDSRLFRPSNKHIISVTLDGVKHEDLNPPLILLFDNVPGRKDCVYWDFQAASGYGNWSDIGCTLAKHTTSSAKSDICLCTHLTHFGQLLSPTFEEEINVVLDIITITGCCISLLGLLGIALTAVVLPDWRQGASKKIQLNLSASLGILMSVFLVDALVFNTQADEGVTWMCFIMGVALHFSVISTFCWMLVAAWFQYLRLTKPLASKHRAPHILIKSAIFAWGLPCVPCGVLLIVSPDSYSSSHCYPTGLAHYITVLTPVAVIISINIVMFVLIICSIYNIGQFGDNVNLKFKYENNPKFQRSVACRKLATLIFLFFLLGLSWIFGIWKMSYLFCSTATLQGLAFFVFFVVLEENTREKWNKLITRRSTPTYPLSTRSSVMSVVRRWSYSSRQTSRTTVSTVSSLS